MTFVKVKYLPTVTEDPEPESKVTQWSLGIAMFAAFVIPFLLLFASARYRLLVDQTRIAFEGITHSSGAGKLPAIDNAAPLPQPTDELIQSIPTPSPAPSHD